MRTKESGDLHWMLRAIEAIPANLLAYVLVDVEKYGDANANDAIDPNVSSQNIGRGARVGRVCSRAACGGSISGLGGIRVGPPKQIQRMFVPFEDGHGEDGLPR